MNKAGCINPEIMKVLSLCGHGDKILIADGNYPVDSKCPNAHIVYLGLCAGIPNVVQVLETILQEIIIEAAAVMVPQNAPEPQIFSEFRNNLKDIPLTELGRYEFYEKAADPDVKLAISTGEMRTFANILITVGVA